MISEAIMFIFVLVLIIGIAVFILIHVYNITASISNTIGISSKTPNLASGIALSALVYLVPIGILILLGGGFLQSLIYPSKFAGITELIFMGFYFVFMLNSQTTFLNLPFITNILSTNLLTFLHSSVFNAIVFIMLSISAGLNFYARN